MYKLIKKQGNARRGEFETVHGTVQTPAFMNVATCGAIKGALSAVDLPEALTSIGNSAFENCKLIVIIILLSSLIGYLLGICIIPKFLFSQPTIQKIDLNQSFNFENISREAEFLSASINIKKINE